MVRRHVAEKLVADEVAVRSPELEVLHGQLQVAGNGALRADARLRIVLLYDGGDELHRVAVHLFHVLHVVPPRGTVVRVDRLLDRQVRRLLESRALCAVNGVELLDRAVLPLQEIRERLFVLLAVPRRERVVAFVAQVPRGDSVGQRLAHYVPEAALDDRPHARIVRVHLLAERLDLVAYLLFVEWDHEARPGDDLPAHRPGALCLVDVYAAAVRHHPRVVHGARAQVSAEMVVIAEHVHELGGEQLREVAGPHGTRAARAVPRDHRVVLVAVVREEEHPLRAGELEPVAGRDYARRENAGERGELPAVRLQRRGIRTGLQRHSPALHDVAVRRGRELRFQDRVDFERLPQLRGDLERGAFLHRLVAFKRQPARVRCRRD